ncbi:MAG TPA: CarD family transcriptional regulator [Myxococcota bacterium]|jgi:CarD family transcriptional regulator|nr:CarD family transcriptional regulator [Myxococcota bacterium]HOD00131.1 CarD family transcriptional regulator [Myxococcota bacterium]HOH76728.1 CarD family transcriptional regulator [Myxococcota bacterium]HPV03835.1 CarD family transcriptional regulator [Myxococcota bacterium]
MFDNFRVGDKAVYPAHGVAEVLGIESREVSGSKQTFYMLKLMDSEHRIMIPLSKAMSVGLRQVIAEEEVPQVFGLLKAKPQRLTRQNWNRRYRGYLEKLKTGSVFDVAEVLRDLCLLRNEKPLSFGEKRLLDTARVLLVEEISVATNGSQDDIACELEAIFPMPLEGSRSPDEESADESGGDSQAQPG